MPPRSDYVVALVHSPLVGPLTWKPVAEELRRRGVEAAVPVLEDGETAGAPSWRWHAESVARALAAIPESRTLILAGHSGAGPLLPAIRQAIGRAVAGYLFVDAGFQSDGESRLDAMGGESPQFAAQLEDHLAAGGRFPEWTDDQLRDIIPDDDLRRGVLAELRPRTLPFFQEPIPVFAGWPDAPCGYIRLSPAYDGLAAHARAAGWPGRSFDAGHFHMLVDPPATAGAMLELIGELLRV
jgi:hypothetical protein